MFVHNAELPPEIKSAEGAGDTLRTLRIRLAGHVQGVGFRPFVYRLALRHGVCGTVQNQLGEVEIIAQGNAASLQQFQRDITGEAPPLARPHITSIDSSVVGRFESFKITASSEQSDARIFVPPDYFTCPDCLRELQDPDDRRYRYPFINCTQCGPRYTLIRALPYDRTNTSMAGFSLCPACIKEYENPSDRRFHAEPLACPDCGPQLSLAAADSDAVLERDTALAGALDRLRQGEVLAVKGIGGYHLMCDARNADAVDKLRQRKKRPDKPLAVMFPMTGVDDLDSVREAVQLSACEAELLGGPIRPIALARKKDSTGLAENLAP